MSTFVILALLARGPLPVPDAAWSQPATVRAAEQQRHREEVHARQQQPARPAQGEVVYPAPEARKVEDRRFGVSLGVGALVGWPSLELEVLPVQHVSGYVAGELSLLAPGYGVQAGVRLRPMEGLVGPWLDVHVRHSHFASLTFSIDEALSPGVAAGFSVESKTGFLFSAGLGVSFLAHTTETDFGVRTASVGNFTVPVPTAETSSGDGAVPELKLQVGWAF